MMKLAKLIHPWIAAQFPDCEISGIHNDSRQVKPGFLFLAYPGAVTDGRLFMSQAAQAGAVAIVYEPENWPADCILPQETINLPLTGLTAKLAKLASRFYEEPTKKLVVTGVTGTNGKTTVAYQLAQAHTLLHEKAAYIGTIGQGEVKTLEPLANTTPDALCLQQLFSQYQQKGIQQVCMEVSSHALDQHRVDEIDFQQAIFTNLSHEHLDYHETMEAYGECKALLFAKPELKWAIINHDDPYSNLMLATVNPACQIILYGFHDGADVRILSYDISLSGTTIELSSPWGQYQLFISALGFFNIYNALAVFSSLMACGYSADKVVPLMSKLQAVPGRMEIVAQEPYMIVDYAHTPDALENVLATLQKVKQGRIIAVFGCGGDRDRSKRPLMGKIASHYADISIITSDNPRNEDPQSIIDAIAKAVEPSSRFYKIIDRKEAIAKAIALANPDDIILVAGKGHEDYQQIGKVRHFFSDQQVIRELRASI